MKLPFLKKYLVIGCMLVTFLGCKSTKIASDGSVNLNLSSKEVIKENSKISADFKTLQAKVRIGYTQGNDSQTHTVSFRMLKDQIIWISSSFNIIRVMITPEKVRYYNKLDNTYFDGDFRFLSDILGTELDFEKVQNLLLGDPLYPLNKTDFSMSVNNDAYLFQPKEQLALFELFYIINPSHFKMDSQQLAQTIEARFLQIDYLNYQKVEKQSLPENIKIIVLEGDKETVIEMEFKSVSLNQDLRYPFSIPSGFEEIVLK
ncbi:DUF4292 domain-containing protein [Xanthomarina sp. F2636L]|uniref:DUF4292 domain-containing protein n=1 Tax=Xanthomarina sp. F2636L TaxID=2996018 RepID=UPI00225E5F75|nr:DUF4292 domain-containing protein [Xanthomarina sp. F2636L]MCX7551369.1 DUF4292 domain-containing protein [Xanthomarina sp. F2636L]